MPEYTSVTGGRFGRNDPLRDFKFKVQIIPNDQQLNSFVGDIGSLGFAVVSGISVQNEMIPYREGGMNTHPHKMVGQSDFAPVTFSRGVFPNQAQMWKWQTFLHRWMQGAGGDQALTDASGAGSKGITNDYRCQIIVTVYDHPFTSSEARYSTDPGRPRSATDPGNARLQFRLYNAWPGGYALSDLNAGSSSIMIQQMTVHHEGFTLDFAPNKDFINFTA